ncbi:MAG: hypothetical protein R6V35_02410 [Candidatus Nanohaloarchaea archaeon]
MTDPRPEDDEQWTVDDELEGDGGEEIETEEEELEEDDGLNISRRQALGLGALGLGGWVAAGAYLYDGGDVAPGIGNNSSDPGTSPIPGGSDENPPEDSSVYELSSEVSVDLDYLDPIFNDSEVEIGIQESGDLVAWNQNVEIGEGDDAYNPLYRFRTERFPDRGFFDVDGDHPIEELYNDIDAEVDEMSEGMVKVFYDEAIDDGTWRDHQDYKPIDFEELKEGLLEHSGPGPTQDYFFNRYETLEEGEEVLEDEWEELVRDGLEANQG